MKKIIFGLFYMLAMISGDAKAGVNAEGTAINQNNGKLQNSFKVAGCAFDSNKAQQQQMINNMRNALRAYTS